ncbi:amidohydrolase [Vibrio alginolyticus]|uniref:amidohydrolase n=1 Tax=Vibrio alginolyticus TaxID=663 RepID=UPI00215D1E46|nr:amidohydrolase [Vibrio alginolyticus]MCR9570947.1 amidohydrolase [Vibrio alginolyticus]
MIEAIKQNNAMFTKWRQDFHKYPEVSYQEHKTAEKIAEMLRSFGVDEVHTGIGGTGLVGVLRGKYPSNKAVGLRADIDALAMTEQSKCDYKSKNNGAMHACGHDGHITMLLASAWYLAQEREFSGTVNFIFQTAEEELTGAMAMIDDGLFDRFPCDRIYGMHNMPGIPQGDIWVREGAIYASCDRFDVEVQGRGGHAAFPSFVVDPTLVLSNIVMSAQTIVSRNTSPIESSLISFTDMHCGVDTYNIVGAIGTMKGCFRSLNPEVRQMTLQRLESVVEAAAVVYGATAKLNVVPNGCPAVINHKDPAKLVTDIATEMLGGDRVNAKLRPIARE